MRGLEIGNSGRGHIPPERIPSDQPSSAYSPGVIEATTLSNQLGISAGGKMYKDGLELGELGHQPYFRTALVSVQYSLLSALCAPSTLYSTHTQHCVLEY